METENGKLRTSFLEILECEIRIGCQGSKRVEKGRKGMETGRPFRDFW